MINRPRFSSCVGVLTVNITVWPPPSSNNDPTLLVSLVEINKLTSYAKLSTSSSQVSERVVFEIDNVVNYGL